jgi:hypothetical protein
MTIGGEEVRWIRVATTTGDRSSLVYVTASGREIRVL